MNIIDVMRETAPRLLQINYTNAVSFGMLAGTIA